MDMYDEEYRDMVVAAYIAFDRRQQGAFQFGTVSGAIDYRRVKRNGDVAIEFSWDGQDEMDPVSGRGWGTINEGQLEGRVFTHRGDDSSFVARRYASRSK